jgi:hypothetical protein
MSSNVSAQQIAGLFTQAGIPAGHSLDIAQRLLSMSNNPTPTSQGPRSYDSTTANNPDFFNATKAKEANAKDGATGKAGKDGLPGYNGTGTAGKDGMPGIPGTPGDIDWDSIKDLIDSMVSSAIQAALASFETRMLERLNCSWFRKKVDDCIRLVTGGDLGGCPKCCKDYGMGLIKGRDICEVLKLQAAEMAKMKRRLDAIEKDLKNTTDCEA